MIFNRFGAIDPNSKEWEEVYNKVRLLVSEVAKISETVSPTEARLLWHEASTLVFTLGCEHIIRRGLELGRLEQEEKLRQSARAVPVDQMI